MSSSNNNKLHPIYVALDSHQYSRAVKLASALPPSNILGQALLAHSLLKSGAVAKGLIVIKGLLWFDSIELDHEIARLERKSGAASLEGGTNASLTKQSHHQPKSKKGGKNRKGIKSTSSSSTASKEESITLSSLPPRDLVEQLETPLVFPPHWDQVVVKPDKQVITDQTTLDTIAVTLQASKCFLTHVQLFEQVTPPTVETLLKSYAAGLYVVAYSSKYPAHVVSFILANMQVAALQLARGVTSSSNNEDSTVLKLWAAQTALWQLQLSSPTNNNNEDPKIQQRMQMLPRWAESLASKTKLLNAEACLLYIRTLQQQEKYEQVVELLTSDKIRNTSLLMTTQQRLEELASAFSSLQDYESAKKMYTMLLIESDDAQQWSYWKGLVHSAFLHGGMESAIQTLEQMLSMTRDEQTAKYPSRAQSLIKCELAAIRIGGVDYRSDTDLAPACSSEDATALQTSIVAYGDEFASRTSCCFSDLQPYIELLVRLSSESSERLLEWSNKMRNDNRAVTDRSMLRSYIFATQVTYKVVSLTGDSDKWLPEWHEVVTSWRASQSLGASKEGETNVQKENQPGDELALLAVQNLLFRNDTQTNQLVMAASLLEEALQISPFNPYLKIAAIDVYARLNAVHRSWELFQGLGTKHVQLDSLSYLIFSKLVDGGLYNEALQVCNEILKFHGTTARDTGEYTVQAMENGILSKASEFMEFQRNRMDASLSLLETKGRIMDCAPLVYVNSKKQATGMNYGIFGGEMDMERAMDFVREAHNPFGAPNIMSVASLGIDVDFVSDNRDFTILSNQILYKSSLPSKEQLVQDSIRRGLLHGLLVRLTLCVDATKSPKKGKVTKASDQLEKRCQSLLDAVDRTNQFLETNASMDALYRECIQAMLVLCRVVALVSAGMPASDIADTLPNRETNATQLFESIELSEMAWSVPSICRFLSDILVPFIAMMRITANLFALYGWGKRKCHTRASAGALAKLAKNLKTVVDSMLNELECLPGSDEDRTKKANELLSAVSDKAEHLDDTSTETVCHSVGAAQQLTRQRVMPFIDEILEDLASFEVESS